MPLDQNVAESTVKNKIGSRPLKLKMIAAEFAARCRPSHFRPIPNLGMVSAVGEPIDKFQYLSWRLAAFNHRDNGRPDNRAVGNACYRPG